MIDMTESDEHLSLSIIIPAKDEAAVIGDVVASVRALYSDAEVIVVNDGSTDDTARIAEQAGARIVSHPMSLGNGAAIKAGARAASGNVLVMMDGDGQHKADDIGPLIDKLTKGYDMAIGARDSGSHAGLGRLAANGLYNVFASVISGHRIPDLTSGFRAVRGDLFRKFLYLLPNGFSYPTTITMAFLRSGHPVTFVPITAEKRTGASSVRYTVKNGDSLWLIARNYPGVSAENIKEWNSISDNIRPGQELIIYLDGQ